MVSIVLYMYKRKFNTKQVHYLIAKTKEESFEIIQMLK